MAPECAEGRRQACGRSVMHWAMFSNSGSCQSCGRKFDTCHPHKHCCRPSGLYLVCNNVYVGGMCQIYVTNFMTMVFPGGSGPFSRIKHSAHIVQQWFSTPVLATHCSGYCVCLPYLTHLIQILSSLGYILRLELRTTVVQEWFEEHEEDFKAAVLKLV